MRAVLVIWIIPVLGLALYFTILKDIPALDAMRISWFCIIQDTTGGPSHQACDDLRLINWIGLASVVSMVIGLAIPTGFWFVARLVGANRPALARVFPPLTFIGIIAVGILFLINAFILAAGAYVAQAHWFGTVWIYVVAILGFVGIAGAFSVMRSAFAMFAPVETHVTGAVADQQTFPRLHNLVYGIADRVQARPPDNIVLGLDDQFFATSARVHARETTLRGETLYISLPLLRAFSIDELSAVIGHELGHFSGNDTAFSLRFAPVYAGLERAVSAVDGDHEGDTNYLGLPAKMVLMSMMGAFSRNVAQASREREFAADKIGSGAASTQDLAYALIKVSVYTVLWAEEERGIIERLQRGRIAKNICANFTERVRYDLDHERIGPALREMLDQPITHPTDSHPPTASRIDALGLELDSLIDETALRRRFSLDDTAGDALDDFEPVEIELTTDRHEIYIAMGVPVADEISDDDFIAALLGDILAHLIRADGRVEDDEIYVAEQHAAGSLEAFDRAHFRERCRATTEIPELTKLLNIANDVLFDEGKTTLIALMEELAGADGSVDPSEQMVIDQAKDQLRLGDNSQDQTTSSDTVNDGE